MKLFPSQFPFPYTKVLIAYYGSVLSSWFLDYATATETKIILLCRLLVGSICLFGAKIVIAFCKNLLEIPWNYLSLKNTLQNWVTCIETKHMRTWRLKNCCQNKTNFEIWSSKGPKVSRTMIAADKNATLANIAHDKLMLRWSVTNCFPKGFSCKYLIIKKRSKPVQVVIEKYIKTRSSFMVRWRLVTKEHFRKRAERRLLDLIFHNNMIILMKRHLINKESKKFYF